MKRYLKLILRRFLGDYEIFNIYCCASPFGSPDRPVEMVEISADLCRQSPYPEIQDLAGYAGRDAKGFGLIDKGELVCACWYWYGEQYTLKRGFWPLEDNEAKLVQITTVESARGKAFARNLIAASSRSMESEGFRCLFARIWFGHTASERVFKAVGWQRIATVLTVQAPFCGQRIRCQWPPQRLIRDRGSRV